MAETKLRMKRAKYSRWKRKTWKMELKEKKEIENLCETLLKKTKKKFWVFRLLDLCYSRIC